MVSDKKDKKDNKKDEKDEKQEKQGDPKESGQSFQERALQRLKDQGDTRVPSDLENFRPADIPPEPLTPYGSSKEESA